MHVAADVDLRADRLARRRHLVDHALHFPRAGGPVEGVVLVRVVAAWSRSNLIAVNPCRGLAGGRRRTARASAAAAGRAPCRDRRGSVAELAAQSWYTGMPSALPARSQSAVSTADSTATNMPDCAPPKTLPFRSCSNSRCTFSGLLPSSRRPNDLHQVIGPRDGVHALAASPDALVGVDLHEQAAAHETALHLGDAQRRRRRRLGNLVEGLGEGSHWRRRGGRARHGQRGEELTAARRVLVHRSSRAMLLASQSTPTDATRSTRMRTSTRTALFTLTMLAGGAAAPAQPGGAHQRAADRIHAGLEGRAVSRWPPEGPGRDPRPDEDRDARGSVGGRHRRRLLASVRRQVAVDSPGARCSSAAR